MPKYSADIDRVEIDIRPMDGGGCELTLPHSMGPAWAEHRGRIEEGWGFIMAALEKSMA